MAIVKRWTGKDLKEFGTQFAESVDEGIGALRGDIGRIAAIAAMLAIEAGMTLLALWLCFESVGQSPGLGVLLAGYGIGLALGMVFLLPVWIRSARGFDGGRLRPFGRAFRRGCGYSCAVQGGATTSCRSWRAWSFIARCFGAPDMGTRPARRKWQLLTVAGETRSPARETFPVYAWRPCWSGSTGDAIESQRRPGAG